ncbi:MAG: hypothetical protein ACLU5J_09060 [Christensenellales bacterium]
MLYMETIITYTLNTKLQGDIRHDGKTFMLATQFIEKNGICESMGKIQLSVMIDDQIIFVDAIDDDAVGEECSLF